MWRTGQRDDEFMVAKMIIGVSPTDGFLKTGTSPKKMTTKRYYRKNDKWHLN